MSEIFETSIDFGGRLLTLQTGKIAKQANSAVLARYGDTVVLVTVVAAKEVKEGQDFLPLTVDFQEKYYSAGRVPGGFFKRESRPSDRATLSARLIDRPIRPLFPDDFMCDTNVVATTLSSDGVNEPEILASIAASAALHLSDIPWNGPIGTCRVGFINRSDGAADGQAVGGTFVLNPPPSEAPNSSMDLLVSGVKGGVIMVEGSAKEVSEKQMNDAISFANESMQPIIRLIEELREKCGKPKKDYDKPYRDEKLKNEIRKLTWALFEKAFSIREKLVRYEALAQLKKTVSGKFGFAEPKTKEEQAKNKLINLYYEELKAIYAREKTLNTNSRIDGRGYADIRPISCDVGLLPRVHGSALFTRGETQVLGTVTLGTSDDEQTVDAISGVYQKTFMLHYNFPPFSVGEAKPLRAPGRREIGHGFLAERALSYMIPPKEKFPYTIRLVSEVLESNGSSSMATVCSGSLALMDAGVPIPKAVAGVAMGLIRENNKTAVLTDILGDEDHLGDMDFKVCGTSDGITAFQMDLKIGGVSREIMEKALEQAREGRLFILDKMNETLRAPRESMSSYAPRIITIKIKPDKIREVIGSGGKVIRSIIERTGAKIDIEDDGSINIASTDDTSAQKAIEIINQIVEEPEVGKIYDGKVTRIADFGAFVEIIPGTEGLCHISELAHYRVRRVEEVVKEGETMQVKCLEVDMQGKIRLSRKALLDRKEQAPPPVGGGGGEGGGGPGNDRYAVRDREPRQDREGQRDYRDRGGRDRGDRDRGRSRDSDRDRDRGGRRFDGPRSNNARFESGDRQRSSRNDHDRGGRDMPRTSSSEGRGANRSYDRDRSPRPQGARDVRSENDDRTMYDRMEYAEELDRQERFEREDRAVRYVPDDDDGF